MNRRITDPHPMPGWADENCGFPETDDESDPKAAGSFWLGYLAALCAVVGVACLCAYAS